MPEVYQDIHALPVFQHAVITIGTFDGVHLGHREVLKQLISTAQSLGGTAVLITFHPHPRQVLDPEKKPVFMLNTRPEKYKLLEAAGIEHVVEVPFTEEFAHQKPEDYVRAFLVGCLHPHTIILGYDHRFGKNREGDYRLLEKLAPELGYRVLEIPEKIIDRISISSTKIREALLQGDVQSAAERLGYPYFLQGRVIHGEKLGRSIGFPTANLQMDDETKLIPANAVYAVWAQTEGNPKKYPAMMNIGIRPTVGGTRRVMEVHLIGFDEDLYEKTLQISFVARLRDEIRFDGLEALQRQLNTDREKSLRALGI